MIDTDSNQPEDQSFPSKDIYMSSDTDTPEGREERLLETLEFNGFEIPDREVALAVLDTPDLADRSWWDVAKLLGVDPNDERRRTEIREMGTDRVLMSQFQELMGAKHKDWVQGAEADRLLAPGDLVFETEQTHLANPVDLHAEIEKIRHDQDAKFDQGYSMNVLISPHSDMVLKTERNNRGSIRSSREALKSYVDIQKTIGQEYLPDQVVARSIDGDRIFILQEKLDPEIWHSSRDADALAEAITGDQQRRVLADFITGAEKLYEEKGLAIDLNGDNLRFHVDETGRLNLKLLDYGCLTVDAQWPQTEAKVQQSLDRLEDLKSFLAADSEPEETAETSHSEIQQIEVLDIVDTNLKKELVEIELGLKPATDAVFRSFAWEEGQPANPINLRGYDDLIEFLRKSKLKYDVLPDTLVEYKEGLREVHRRVVVAKTDEARDKLVEAIGRRDDRLNGEAYGFPKTAIDAYVSGEILDDEERSKIIEDFPDLRNYMTIHLSRTHWREEVEFLARKAEAVKQASPKIFNNL